MTIHLPETIERSIDAAVESGRFPSVAAAVAAAWLAFEQIRQGQAAPKPAAANGEGLPTTAEIPIWEDILELTADVPEEEWDKLPADLAEQHDHYIYGTPKRPVA